MGGGGDEWKEEVAEEEDKEKGRENEVEGGEIGICGGGRDKEIGDKEEGGGDEEV